MLNLKRALENDRLLRSLTGLNRKAFDELSQVFDTVYQETLQTSQRWRTQSEITERGSQTVLHLVLLQVLSHI